MPPTTLPLVRLDNVDVALDGRVILRGLNWRLRPGENWAVLGGNGSGKSTFLRLVRGELWPAPGGGERVFALNGDEQTSAVGVKEAMPLVSPEVQERCLRLEWTRTVRQVIESGIGGGDYLYTKATAAQRERLAEAVEMLGIAALLRRNVQQLSTGELRKVLIARALAGAPRVLVCDEVCDGLDAASRAHLLEALNHIAADGTQLLFTTHRSEELVPTITHRLVLREGRIVEQGLATAARGVAFQGRAISNRCATLESRAPEESSDSSHPRLRRSDPVTPAESKILIRIERAAVFLGGRRVLHDVNWQLRAGEHWAITGPNGSGKTTLLKLISGDLHPALGSSVRRFEFTPENTLWELRRRIGCVSPELQANYRERLTGAEVIASGFTSSVGFIERPAVKLVRRAAALAAELGFGALAQRSALEMSYGEFRKILLARALVHGPELLILDEPFDGLDAAAKADLARVLDQVARRGASLVMVTHHGADLPGFITHSARLENGRIVEQGMAGDGRRSSKFKVQNSRE